MLIRRREVSYPQYQATPGPWRSSRVARTLTPGAQNESSNAFRVTQEKNRPTFAFMNKEDRILAITTGSVRDVVAMNHFVSIARFKPIYNIAPNPALNQRSWLVIQPSHHDTGTADIVVAFACKNKFRRTKLYEFNFSS